MTTMMKSNQQQCDNGKLWTFESIDLTVSTVDTDSLSVSSCSDNSSLSSDDASPLIIETTLRRTTSSSSAANKSVSFAQDKNGCVQCYTKEIERVDDPALWWNPEENRSILLDCCQVVDYYKKGRPRRRLCNTVSNLFRLTWLEDDQEEGEESHPLDAILDFLQDQDPQVLGRGLEQHIVGSSKEYVVRHRHAVLAALDSMDGMRYIADQAASTSEDCKELARCIGIHDEVEASSDDCVLAC